VVFVLQKGKITRDRIFSSAAEFFFWICRKVLQRVGNTDLKRLIANLAYFFSRHLTKHSVGRLTAVELSPGRLSALSLEKGRAVLYKDFVTVLLGASTEYINKLATP
jgi:hypothetical protein